MNDSALLLEKIKSQASTKEIDWITSKVNNCSLQSLQTAFVATPRFISKNLVQSLDKINGVSVDNWTLDRLVRVYLLTHFDSSDKNAYTKAIDTLFDTAENNEAVALISALSFLSFSHQKSILRQQIKELIPAHCYSVLLQQSIQHKL